MVRVALAVQAPSARAGRLALLAALLGGGAPAAAQVRQPPPPVQRPDLQRRDLPQAPVGDLVITAVTVRDVPIPAPATSAQVTVQNKGAAAVTFPAGSVLVRAEAGAAGGITFQPMSAPSDYTIGAGESKTLTLSAGDPCTAGKAGKVTFRADPDNRVRETDEANNTFVVASVGSFTTGDLQALGAALHSTGPEVGTDKSVGRIPAAYPADLEVTIRNAGTGPALLCTGATLFRETQSPLSSKYGLRTVAAGGSVKSLQPGAVIVSKLSNAYAAGDLPPGNYSWAVLVNPDGRMPEASAANNAASTGVTVH